MCGWRRVDFMFRLWFLNCFDHTVICYELLNNLYSIVKLVPIFWNNATYLQTQKLQLLSGKFIPLSHKAESTCWWKFRSGKLHFLTNFVSRSGKHIPVKILEWNAAKIPSWSGKHLLHQIPFRYAASFMYYFVPRTRKNTPLPIPYQNAAGAVYRAVGC